MLIKPFAPSFAAVLRKYAGPLRFVQVEKWTKSVFPLSKINQNGQKSQQQLLYVYGLFSEPEERHYTTSHAKIKKLLRHSRHFNSTDLS